MVRNYLAQKLVVSIGLSKRYKSVSLKLSVWNQYRLDNTIKGDELYDFFS